MHDFHAGPIVERSLIANRPGHDLVIDLDRHHARDREMLEQGSDGQTVGDFTRIAVHHELHRREP